MDDLKNKKLSDIEDRVKEKGLKNLESELEIGELTLKDIIKELQKPGRDPREDMPKPILKTGVIDLKDLQSGMELNGYSKKCIRFWSFC